MLMIMLVAYDYYYSHSSKTRSAISLKPSATRASAQASPTETVALFDGFSGTSLDDSNWNARSCGHGRPVHQVSDGTITLAPCEYITTQNKRQFSGAKIVIEARFVGPKNSGRDTNLSLVDVSSNERIQVGDTNYQGFGLYYYVTDSKGHLRSEHVTFGGTTNEWREYRLTLVGDRLTIERGSSLESLVERHDVVLPITSLGRSFFVQLSTGGADGFYSPAKFDWVRVKTTAK